MRHAHLLALIALAACSDPPAATPAAVADVAPAADVVATDVAPVDAVDPWAGAPPALCRKGAAPWQEGQATFTDITVAVGIGDAATPSATNGLAVAGVRLSTADLDGDDYPELLVRHMAQGVRDTFQPGKRILYLLHNEAKSGKWTFTETTQASGITQTRDGATGRACHIAVFGDADNDGDTDVFCGATIPTDPAKDLFAKDASELMLNDGKGNFTLTGQATFAASKLRRALSSASFTDYDRDGKLDLWLGYTTWSDGKPMQNPLLRGDGAGDFSDVTAAEGLTTKPYSKAADIESGAAHRNTWGSAACDMNGDGWPDLLTVSYGRYFNGFWLGGTLGSSGARFDDMKDVSLLGRDDDDDWTTNINAQCWCQDNPKDAECDKAPKPKVNCVQLKAAFGGQYRWYHPQDRKPYRLGGNTGTAVCADLDRDGDLDLVEMTIVHPDVGPSADPTRIILNDGKKIPTFEHLHGDQSGLQHSFDKGQADDVGDMTGAVLDFDGDGRIDVLIASSDYPGTHAMLFHQLADGTFEEVPVPQGIDHKHAHGVAVADFDRDGDLDVVLGHSLARCNLSPKECQKTEQVHVFRNDFATPGNWLELKLVGGGGANRSAIGARIEVKAGGATQTFEVGGGYGHWGMQQDLVVHVGLGSACAVDEVKVRWPDAAGTTEVWHNVRANYFAELTQGSAKPAYPLWKP